jgi:hypothetical protein
MPACRRILTPLSKSRKHNSLTEGRKAVIYTTTRTLSQCLLGVRFLACLSLRKTAGTLGEKVQNPNHRAQGSETKTKTKTKSRCVNLNAE